MATKFNFHVLYVLLVLCTLCGIQVYAEEENFVFFLDKSQYHHRDVIEISGWVTEDRGSEIFIEILNPNNQIVTQEFSKLIDARKIEHKIPTLRNDWSKAGFYTIHVNYGNETQSRLFAFGNFDTKEFEPLISLDKISYSWTDIVKIEILSPNDNKNNYRIDQIKVDISTSLSSLTSYVLEETGLTHGIFTGLVTLTGDSEFDVDGDGRRGDALGFTFGQGPKEGNLETRPNDQIIVIFSSPNFEKIVEKTASIQFNIGQVEWIDDQIDPNQNVLVRVTDPDLRLHPTKKDQVKVFVSSFSQTYSEIFTLTETEINSGVFEGYITFIQWPNEDGVLVHSGTEVSVKYIDRTLPPSRSKTTQEITDTAKVIDLDDPFASFPDAPFIDPESSKPIPKKEPEIISHETPEITSTKMDYQPPVKQFKSGIPFHEIKCNSGLQLIQRYDGHPACVKPNTHFELITRGWALLPDYENKN